MVELGYTQSDIARKLHMSSPAVCQKINNIRPINLDEAIIMAEFLRIGKEEFWDFFLM